MNTLVCSAQSVTALSLLNQMLSVRLGKHELIEWSLDVERHPYFNPSFHIWGSTRVHATNTTVKIDAEFELDVQCSRIVSHPGWWMTMHKSGVRLEIDGIPCWAFWDPQYEFWTILRSIDLTAYNVSPEGFYSGMPIMFTGTDDINRWSHDKVVRKFFPPRCFKEMKP